MKYAIYLLATALMSTNAYASKLSDLKFNCQGKVQIIETSNPRYSPAVPPHGRFNGSPARSSFEAKVKVTQLNPTCETLKNEYGLDLEAIPLKVNFSISPARELEEAKNVATWVVGKRISVHTKQYFQYVVEGQYLPLFPKAHAEQIALTGKVASRLNIEFEQPLPIDLEKAYGTIPVEKMTDTQKLELAQSAAYILAQNNRWDVEGLYLSLEPKAEDFEDQVPPEDYLVDERILGESSI